MWDKIILFSMILIVALSVIGLIYILIRKPNEVITIKTRTALIVLIALGLLLINSYLN
jgi:hypothetical protein